MAVVHRAGLRDDHLVCGRRGRARYDPAERAAVPCHPIFNARRFAMASRDRFFLCIESKDPKFDQTATRRFLESLGPREVSDVER
jgi:hypothetical protein